MLRWGRLSYWRPLLSESYTDSRYLRDTSPHRLRHVQSLACQNRHFRLSGLGRASPRPRVRGIRKRTGKSKPSVSMMSTLMDVSQRYSGGLNYDK